MRRLSQMTIFSANSGSAPPARCGRDSGRCEQRRRAVLHDADHLRNWSAPSTIAAVARQHQASATGCGDNAAPRRYWPRATPRRGPRACRANWRRRCRSAGRLLVILARDDLIAAVVRRRIAAIPRAGPRRSRRHSAPSSRSTANCSAASLIVRAHVLAIDLPEAAQRRFRGARVLRAPRRARPSRGFRASAPAPVMPRAHETADRAVLHRDVAARARPDSPASGACSTIASSSSSKPK